MDRTKTIASLEKHGFRVREFATGAEASDYLNAQIDGVSVAFSGSVTLQQLGLYESLSAHNELLWHWKPGEGRSVGETLAQAMHTEVYLCSANAVTEDGTLVNMDGVGNRISSIFYGHRRLYYVVSEKKLVKDLAAAEERIRNVATPRNCKRMGLQTPCAVRGDRCYHCEGANCPMCGMSVQLRPMIGVETEVLLLCEDFGY